MRTKILLGLFAVLMLGANSTYAQCEKETYYEKVLMLNPENGAYVDNGTTLTIWKMGDDYQVAIELGNETAIGELMFMAGKFTIDETSYLAQHCRDLGVSLPTEVYAYDSVDESRKDYYDSLDAMLKDDYEVRTLYIISFTSLENYYKRKTVSPSRVKEFRNCIIAQIETIKREKGGQREVFAQKFYLFPIK